MSATTIAPVLGGITGTMCVLPAHSIKCGKRTDKSPNRLVQNLNNLIFDLPFRRSRFHGAVRKLAGTGSVELRGKPNGSIKRRLAIR